MPERKPLVKYEAFKINTTKQTGGKLGMLNKLARKVEKLFIKT